MPITALGKWLWKIRQQYRVREKVMNALRRWRSLSSRKALVEEYLRANSCARLQVGCGKNILDGWMNTDLVVNGNIIYLDATKPLPFGDNTLDYIFSEHIFEHISYADGHAFIKECHRVLKPGGRIRIATPDMVFLIQLYQNPASSIYPDYIKFAVDTFVTEPRFYSPGVVVNNFFYSWGHRFIYDFETLGHTLATAGFINIVRCKPGESDDPKLANLEQHGKIIGDRFNLLESIVVEAAKSA